MFKWLGRVARALIKRGHPLYGLGLAVLTISLFFVAIGWRLAVEHNWASGLVIIGGIVIAIIGVALIIIGYLDSRK